MTVIYANANWYQGQPSTERMWQGILQERQASQGPSSRLGLNFTLVTSDGELPVYAANVVPKLMPLVNTSVVVRGKLVDLKDEGFGPELWIGSIQPSDDESTP
ncbi:hypothetical protein [Acaryochloris sp. IP29b_bin.148]|uniref:hypothetical protein n=1 Tax=Acaryochloris sp. IP29b_bin.148 TaxID=2969218 RepID=UPI00262A78FC|nr:hypothetical protein [Acaryochloris sp. IP29b_bin.148]